MVGDFPRENNDFYSPPLALTLPILRFERFEGAIWDPACGDGRDVARSSKGLQQGHQYRLIYRGYGEGDVDFLKQDCLLAPNTVKPSNYGCASPSML
jgi:hypothetical protein